MPDRHRDPTVSVRPTADDKQAAAEALGEWGWTIGDALHAALLWLLDDPRRLAELERFRPPAKTKGRPPNNARPRGQ
ncbi:hypothetical protein [Actinoplanes rectilineatus]|uniref:hypothetical protein n=1 Tax=Actinoplanes rectilineatus TaxID=113571 RepID=UPI0005F2F447|nr:hypothetical protein [Actinoplanes rectilineatus]